MVKGKKKLFFFARFFKPFLSLKIARVPPFASCWTLYHTLGDVFGWICAALSALILISVVLPEAVLARLTPKIVRDALTSKYTPFLDQPMN